MGLFHDVAVPLVATALDTVYGEDVTYTPIGTGLPAAVRGIFDSLPTLVTTGTREQVQGAQPQLSIRLDELLVRPRVNDLVTIRGIAHRVSAVAVDDGTGWATLTLVWQA